MNIRTGLSHFLRFGYRKPLNSFIEIVQTFRKRQYQDTTQHQAYTVESFVGHIGGYMGLFCGFALVQLPKLIVELLASGKNAIAPRK